MQKKRSGFCFVMLIMAWIVFSGARFLFSTEVGTFGYNFTVDGPTTFLLSMSYYNPLDLRIVDSGGIRTPKYAMLEKDFREMKNRGFNCIRIFVNNGNNDWGWSGCVKSSNCAFGEPLINLSPFKLDNGTNGTWINNEPYLKNLKALIGLCDEMGIVVDITMWRSQWGDVNLASIVPTNYEEHKNFAVKFTQEFMAYRNWFFDVLNEWDVQTICENAQVMDHSEKLSQLYSVIKAVKAIDPNRKCSASCSKGPLLDKNGGFGNFTIVDKNTNQVIGPKSTIQHCLSMFDFFALHEKFDSVTAMNEMIAKLQGEGVVRPIYFQEPSRRYTTDPSTPPLQGTFLNDLQYSSLNGAAGWCLHNGNSNNGNGIDIPKSFYLNYGDDVGNDYDQGLLFVGRGDLDVTGQLDSVELAVANQAHAKIPFIEVLSPHIGENWVLHESKTIGWSFQNISGDAPVEIGVMKNTPNGYQPAGLINTQVHLNNNSVLWEVGKLEDGSFLTAGQYKLCVQAKWGILHIENGANFSFSISSRIIGSAGSGGTVNPTNQIVEAGGSCTVNSQPSFGYQIKRVLVNESLDVTAQVKANGNNYTFTNVQTNQSLRAEFEVPATSFRVTSMVLNWTGGAITQTAGPIVARGSNVPFHYLADPDYILHHIGIHASSPPSPLIAQYTIDEFTGWWVLDNVQQDLWVVFAFVHL